MQTNLVKAFQKTIGADCPGARIMVDLISLIFTL